MNFKMHKFTLTCRNRRKLPEAGHNWEVKTKREQRVGGRQRFLLRILTDHKIRIKPEEE